MIKIYYRSIKEKRFSLLDAFKTGAWVNVSAPDEAEIEKLEKMLGVEKSLLQDALDPYEVPRIEKEDGAIYVFTRVPEIQSQEIITIPILIVLGDNFVLTIANKELRFLEKFTAEGTDFFTTQKTKLFLEIFLSINKQYDIFLISISKRIRGLKIKLEKMKNKDLIQFVDLERILNDFLSALIPTSAVLKKILDGRSIVLYEDDQDLIEDISLGNGQMIEMAKSSLKHVVNIRNTSFSIITHDLNRIMKILTALTILLTIPTMIFSFYGMNVEIPHANYPHIYIVIIFFTGLSSLLFLILLKKNRWL